MPHWESTRDWRYFQTGYDKKASQSHERTEHYLVRVVPLPHRPPRDRRGRGDLHQHPGLTQAEARQGVLITKLQHRTRDLLTVVQSIAGHRLDPLPLVSHRYGLDDAADAYALIDENPSAALQVVLDFA